jgi:hypothetical protein
VSDAAGYLDGGAPEVKIDLAEHPPATITAAAEPQAALPLGDHELADQPQRRRRGAEPGRHRSAVGHGSRFRRRADGFDGTGRLP